MIRGPRLLNYRDNFFTRVVRATCYWATLNRITCVLCVCVWKKFTLERDLGQELHGPLSIFMAFGFSTDNLNIMDSFTSFTRRVCGAELAPVENGTKWTRPLRCAVVFKGPFLKFAQIRFLESKLQLKELKFFKK